MQGSELELDSANDQRAFNRLMKKTIGHGYDTDDLGYAEGDEWSGKVLDEVFRQNKLTGTFSPPTAPALSPRMRSRPSNLKSWVKPGAVTSIPLTRQKSVDESDDEALSDSTATPRGSDSEDLDTTVKPKKKWYDSFKSKSPRKKKMVSESETDGNTDDESWQKSNASQSESDTEGGTKKKKSSWFSRLNPRVLRKDVVPPQPVPVGKYFEELLDKRSLHELIMMTLLICPNNDGPENYRMMRMSNTDRVSYQLERISGSTLFVKPIQNLDELHCRCILFCFDTMLEPIDSQARETLATLKNQPFQGWFTYLRKINVSMRDGLSEDMYFRRRKMQSLLRMPETVTLMDLMRKLDPDLYGFYHKAFEQHDVIARFKQLPIFKPTIPVRISPAEQLTKFKKYHEVYQVNPLHKEHSPKIEVAQLNMQNAVRDLDLSKTHINDLVLHKISLYCHRLQSLSLANSKFSEINVPIKVVHLDLSNTSISQSIFMSLRENCASIRTLKINHCANLTMISMQDVSFLQELDVSHCANLTVINSVIPQAAKKFGSRKIMLVHPNLHILRANFCAALAGIIIDDAIHLNILQANHNALTEVSLSLGQPLPNLRIVELNSNASLREVMITPVRLLRFTAFFSHNIKPPLNEEFCQRLLDQIDTAPASESASAASLYMRVKVNSVDSAYAQRGNTFFTKREFPDFDGSHANLTGLILDGSNLSHSVLTNACLSNASLRGCRMTGVSLGRLATFRIHDRQVMALDHTADNIYFASADAAGKVVLRTSLNKVFEFQHPGAAVQALKFSPDGKKLAVAGTMRSQEVATSRLVEEDCYAVYLYDINPNSKTCFQQLLKSSSSHASEVKALAFSTDGFLFSAGEDGKLKVRNLATGLMHKVLDSQQSELHAMSINKKNYLTCATGGSDGSINIWNTKTYTMVVKIEAAHTRRVNCLCFSPDGKFLISGGDDKLVKIWNVSTWQLHQKLEGHKEVVTAVAVDPHSQLVFSGDALGYEGSHSLLVWNIKTGERYNKIQSNSAILAIDVESQPHPGHKETTWIVHTACGNNEILRYLILNKKLNIPEERSDCSYQLKADGLDISGMVGASFENVIVLKQLGAKGEPATAEQSAAVAEEEMPTEIDEESTVVLQAPGLY